MLDTTIKAQLEQYLALLESQIELSVSLDASAAANEMQDLLGEIAAMSDKISLVITEDKNSRAPSFTISQSSEPARIRFAGIPMGHEFTSLILALLQTSGRAPKITVEQIAQIIKINHEKNLNKKYNGGKYRS